MEFIIHGAGQEVGRSCVEVKAEKSRFLFDAGIKISPEMEYPLPLENIEQIDAVFVSHAHLDHSGMLPRFSHAGLKCPVVMTRTTKMLVRELLLDAYQIDYIQDRKPPYPKKYVELFVDSIETKKLRTEYKIKDLKFKIYDAGHIPGSTSVMVNADGKNILYTGDINTTDTQLLYGADTDYEEKIDVMITEATYGDRSHPDRKQTEKEFIQTIEERIQHGPVVIAVFAVGRAQEIMLLLRNKVPGVTLYLDGMAKRVGEKLLNFPKDIKNMNDFRKGFNRVKRVHGMRERKRIIKEKAIFITTSGMVTGGPIMDYLKHLYKKPNASVLLTGYQTPDGNGRMLLDKKKAEIDGQMIEFKGFIKQFDFSAHSGQKELHDHIEKVNPKVLIINHGDPSAALEMKAWAEGKGIKTHAPKNGDIISV